MRLACVAAAAIPLALLTGCGSADGPSETRLEPPSSTGSAALLTEDRCADVVVLGLRGQGQSASGNQGMGREVLLNARALVPRLPDGTTVRLAAIRHPARLSPTQASYDADVATGVRMVQQRLASLAAACPRTQVAVIGFSEGSQVVHQALAATATDVSRVALVVMIGDPLRDPDAGLQTVDFGTRLEGRGSNGPGPPFRSSLQPRVLEVCVSGDNVCNAPLSGRRGGVSETHRTYYERPGATGRIADTAAAILG